MPKFDNQAKFECQKTESENEKQTNFTLQMRSSFYSMCSAHEIFVLIAYAQMPLFNAHTDFFYIHALCMREANVLASLRIRLGSPMPSFLDNAICCLIFVLLLNSYHFHGSVIKQKAKT